MYRHLLHAPIYHSFLIVVFFLLIHIPDHIHHQQYARLQPYFCIHAGCLTAEFITQIQQFGRRIFIILSHSLFISHINLIQPLLITPVIFIRSQAKQKIIRNSPDGCSLKYFIYVHILPILSLSRNISLLRNIIISILHTIKIYFFITNFQELYRYAETQTGYGYRT